jgi:hypothetical protein
MSHLVLSLPAFVAVRQRNKIVQAIEDSQRCASRCSVVAVGCRCLLVLPFWVPFWELEDCSLARDLSVRTVRPVLVFGWDCVVATVLTFWLKSN